MKKFFIIVLLVLSSCGVDYRDMPKKDELRCQNFCKKNSQEVKFLSSWNNNLFCKCTKDSELRYKLKEKKK